MNSTDREGSAAGSDPPSEALSAYAQYLQLSEQDPEAAFDSFCERRPQLASALRRLHRTWGDVGDALDQIAGNSSGRARRSRPMTEGEALPQTLERLASPRRAIERYRVLDEIAHGGMGRVLRVWDEDLRRQVAMKVVLEPSFAGGASEVGGEQRTRRLARFLEEAQITGQLDHPGIVPVHELGLDDEGRVFFTLKLVRGRELRKVFQLVRAHEEGWNQTRALGALLRVCEAMAFAHEHGVVHRDLKPSNIMVGRHGETYVMDWGLARLTKGAEEAGKLGDSDSTQWDGVLSERHESGSDTPGSPLVTADGEILGTPQYMSPEQARGELDRIGPPADVYAVGAMLYELLAAQPPFPKKGPAAAPYAVIRSVIQGPPPQLSKVAPTQPPELVAICEKAMARRIDERYPEMSEMAEDVRAFLENRVVRAWRTGAWVELRKWVGRNRGVAALLGLLIVLSVGAGLLWAWQERARQRERLDRLAQAYVEEGERSWPVHPDHVPEMERWLAGAREVVAALPRAQQRLEALRKEGTIVQPEHATLSPSVLALREEHLNLAQITREFRDELLKLRNGGEGQEYRTAKALLEEIWNTETLDSSTRLDRIERRLQWLEPRDFPDTALAAEHSRIAKLVINLEQLGDQEHGLISKTAQRVESARSLPSRSLVEAAQEWERAVSSIADPAECPEYNGLRIEPQLGLVPLRLHAHTGLWEFWHVLSGERPELSTKDEWIVRPETGLVFVLIPGGEYWIGAQSEDPEEPNYDPVEHYHSVPHCKVELWPYLLSKYEMTQGQWGRLTNTRPSTYAAGLRFSTDPTLTRTHPVESVSWEDCRKFLYLWQLELPTEARWESAARAGFGAPYGLFETFEELPPGVNCADETYHRHDRNRTYVSGYEDGWRLHAPVDKVEANPWGLFGVYGNVSEWTRDSTNSVRAGYGLVSGDLPRSKGTGEIQSSYRSMRTYRGGSFLTMEALIRPASSNVRERNTRQVMIGVRPARSLEGHQEQEAR